MMVTTKPSNKQRNGSMKNKQGIDWTKKNMFDGIGRKDLKPKKSTGFVEYLNKLLRK